MTAEYVSTGLIYFFISVTQFNLLAMQLYVVNMWSIDSFAHYIRWAVLYRVRHVELAFQSGAIETLLISDELFRFVSSFYCE